MKNYTNLEQSKKLLKLRLSPESADMQYLMLHDRAIDGGGNRLSDIPSLKVCTMSDDIPCWSVGALLELVTNFDAGPVTLHCNEGEVEMSFNSYKTNWYKHSITACYEMIVWLLENGYIKKG